MNPHIAHPVKKNPFVAAASLQCPRCGEGRLFSGLLRMNKTCSHCGLTFEREVGFYLGSIYINYGATVLLAGTAYSLLVFRYGFPKQVVFPACALFTVLFPLWFFRYARSLFLASDYNVNPERGDVAVQAEAARTVASLPMETAPIDTATAASHLNTDDRVAVAADYAERLRTEFGDEGLAAMRRDDAAAGRAIGIIVGTAFLFGLTMIGTALYISVSISR